MDNLGRETEQTEFKESTAKLDEGIISLCAMLNRSCFGEVFFGVRDNGDVVGMDIGKTTLKRISETVRRDMDPPLLPKLEVIESSDGREYISMSARGNDRPYLVKGVAYVRCGEEDRRATQHELKAMLRSAEDYLAKSTARNQDLTFTEFCLILKGRGIDVSDDRRLHHSFSLLNDEEKFNIQAELLSDQNVIPLTVVVFNGLDRTSVSQRTDHGGRCLLVEAVSVLNFVKSLNERSVAVSGGERMERDLFDFEAFKEAWVNACAHNNWMSTMPPAVHIFDDRLEIVSYGDKPYWLSDDDFFSGRSMPVNESLMRAFVQAGLSERTGHGVPVIVESYGRGAFEFSAGQMVVTMRFTRPRLASASRGIRTGLTKNELMVFDAMKDDPSITQDEIASLSGLSKGFVAKTTSKLKNMDLVERVGSRKSGYWRVIGPV